MPISVSGTSITFNDNTTQTTAASGIISTAVTAYDNPGTFTTPANTTRVFITLVGGGGGFGGPGNNSGGGGGVSLIASGYYPVSASTPYPITVGNAGTNNNTNAAGNAGNASSFGNILTSNGGNGGGVGPGTPESNPGTPGNNGTAPLAQITAEAGFNSLNQKSSIASALVYSSSAGGGGTPAPFKGKVVVYY